MSETLLLRMFRDDAHSASWVVVNSAGELLRKPQSGPLTLLTPIAAERRVIVLVPASSVTLLNAQIPQRQQSRLLQLAPFALEEQLAEDIESLHFAAGKREGDSANIEIAVVSRAFMDTTLAALRTAGIEPAELVSDAQLLPSHPADAVALIDGDEILIRTARGAAAALPAADLASAFEITLAGVPDGAQLKDSSVIIHVPQREWPDQQRAVESLRPSFGGLKVQLLPEGALPLLAAQLHSSDRINLLQGDYRPKSAGQFEWRRWRLAAALAVASLGLYILGHAVELRRLARAESALDARIDQLYRSVIPGERAPPDARRRLEAQLGGSSAGPELLQVLSDLAASRANVRDAQLLAFTYRDGALELRMRAQSAEQLDGLGQSLRQRGWDAEFLGGGTSRDHYEGRIKVRFASS